MFNYLLEILLVTAYIYWVLLSESNYVRLINDEFEEYIFINTDALDFELAILEDYRTHLEFSKLKRNYDIDYY